MTCRTCKYFVVEPDRDGKVRIRKDNAYRCSFDVNSVALPTSFLIGVGSYSYGPPDLNKYKKFVTPDGGADCRVREDKS